MGERGVNPEVQPLAPGDLLTVSQAVPPIGRSTPYKLVETGALPSFRVAAAGARRGRILIARADLEAFLGSARQTREELASC